MSSVNFLEKLLDGVSVEWKAGGLKSEVQHRWLIFNEW